MKIKYDKLTIEFPNEIVEEVRILAEKLDMQLEHIQKEYPLPEG